MLTSLLFTIVFIFIWLYLKDTINNFKSGDPKENNDNYWMFSYDFKSTNKEWVPENSRLLIRKRKRNALIFILYINVFLIFLAFNSFIAHLLDFIINIERFHYPI